MRKESLKQTYKGKVSVVLINTLLGDQIWEKYKDFFCYEERTIKEAIDGNDQLRNPSAGHPDRKKFLSEYKKNGFVKAVKTPKICWEIRKGKMKSTALYITARKFKRSFCSDEDGEFDGK